VIVIGGGWVPLVYYHYLLADKSREPIRTRDIDLLVDIQVPMVGDKTVDRLLLEAGFEPIFKSSDTPPVIHYEGTIDGEEVEIEFLTDQRGPRDDVVIGVQKGLHAEAFPKMTEGQFREYIIGIFKEFIGAFPLSMIRPLVQQGRCPERNKKAW